MLNKMVNRRERITYFNSHKFMGSIRSKNEEWRMFGVRNKNKKIEKRLVDMK